VSNPDMSWKRDTNTRPDARNPDMSRKRSPDAAGGTRRSRSTARSETVQGSPLASLRLA